MSVVLKQGVSRHPSLRALASDPLRGGEVGEDSNTIAIIVSLSRRAGSGFDLSEPAAGCRRCRKLHSSLLRTPQHEETLKIMITTHFLFRDHNPEVGCNHYFECLRMLGSPAEACAGSLYSQKPAAVSGKSKQAHAPLESNVILSSASLPSPLPR